MVRVERYGPGAEATDFDPGDFILTHRHRFFAGLISVAQRRRFKGPDSPYAHWSHTALIVGSEGEVVEAESLGVVRSPISKYRAEEYHVVRLGPDFPSEGRRLAVDFAEQQVGQAFGYLNMLGAGVYLLFGWPLRWVRGSHETCSTLVVRALQKGGVLRDFDAALTLPADLAKAFDVRP